MKSYWRLLGFAKPIEKYAIPYFFYVLIYSIFNACIFSLIMPIAKALFDNASMLVPVEQMPPFELNLDYLNELLKYFIFRIFGADYDIVSVMILLGIVISLAALTSNMFRYMAQRTAENMKIRTLQRIRNTVYDNVINLNVGFFSNERKGDIISRITSDVQVIQYCITNTLQVIFRDPLLILTYLFVMIVISPKLTLFSIIYLPAVSLVIGIIAKRLRKPAKRVQESFGEMTSVLDESLGGMKVIKGYNAEGFFARKFHVINDLYSRTSKRMSRRQQLASPISEFMGIAAVAGLFVFGGVLFKNGEMDGSSFLAFIAIFSQIIRPVISFADAFANINQGIAAGNRVLGLIDTPNTITQSPDAVEFPEFRNSIEFRDVRFSYESKEVICGISFKVAKGEMVALVGPSGGGKSTIADLIPRFYDVTGGEILIDGIDIKDYDLESMRDRMGIVAQETVLFNDTIENNIRLGNEQASMEDIVAAARVANADRFIMDTSLGYETNIGDRGTKLSGGQRQRLSIARAVLRNPEILILDEATSALDTESEKLVQQALNSLLEGRTSIVVAHRLSTIQGADRIIVVDAGRIVEEGTHEELMRNRNVYAKLIEMQQLG